MKLLFCSNCYSAVNLIKEDYRECACGKVKGKITESGIASYTGPATPMVITTKSFYKAVSTRKTEGAGSKVIAFIPAVGDDYFVKTKTNEVNGNR